MATKSRHLLIVFAVLAAPAHAQNFQSLDAVDARAMAHLGPGGTLLAIDRRLKLAACPDPLVADGPALGAVTVRCPALGWRVRVIVNSSQGASAIVIRRGDPVSVQFAASAFTVSAQGTAESDARAGDPVRVRIEPRRAPVTGRAVEPGSVRIGD